MQTRLSPYWYYFLCVGPIDYQGRASQVRLEDLHVPTLSSSIQKLYIYFLISHNVSICSKLICIQHHQTAVLTQVKNCVELPSHSEPTKDISFSSQTKVFGLSHLLCLHSWFILNREAFIHAIAWTHLWIIFWILHWGNPGIMLKYLGVRNAIFVFEFHAST